MSEKKPQLYEFFIGLLKEEGGDPLCDKLESDFDGENLQTSAAFALREYEIPDEVKPKVVEAIIDAAVNEEVILGIEKKFNEYAKTIIAFDGFDRLIKCIHMLESIEATSEETLEPLLNLYKLREIIAGLKPELDPNSDNE